MDWIVNNGEFLLIALNAIYTAFVQAQTRKLR